MKRMLLLSVCVLVALTGCGTKGDSPADIGDAAAVVNGDPISVAEVVKVAKNLKSQGAELPDDVEGDTPEARFYNMALDRLVEQRLLVAEAEAAGVTVSEEEVEASVQQLRTMAGTEQAFQDLLDRNQATVEDVYKDMRANLILRQYFDVIMEAPPEVSDEDVEAYYRDNPEEFAPKPEVHARHILIRTEPDADDMAKADARRQIEEVHAKLLAGGDFILLAQEFSQDPTTAQNGGDLQWFGHGMMVAPFDSAAFALEPGEISGVVETQFGYHILKLDDRRMSQPVDLEESREGIRSMLSQQKTQDRFRETVDAVTEKADIKKQPPSAETLAEI